MEIKYWSIENYSSNVINLMNESKEKIYTDKLTLKDVEKYTNLKLRVARSYENPQIICSSKVEENGRIYSDIRKFRGTPVKYYMIIN